jgi:hypothetical protein
MTLMTETDDEELPVSQETIEKAIGVVHEYVAELREMLRAHLTDLHRTTITTAHATMRPAWHAGILSTRLACIG